VVAVGDPPDAGCDGRDQGGLVGLDCDEAVHELYHYLDGELTEERRRLIAVHLDLCAPCAHAVGFEAELRQVIAQRCTDRVPDSLLQRVAAAIDEEQQGRGPGGPSGRHHVV